MSLFRPITNLYQAGTYYHGEWVGVVGFEPTTWFSAGTHSFHAELNAQDNFSLNYLKFLKISEQQFRDGVLHE